VFLEVTVMQTKTLVRSRRIFFLGGISDFFGGDSPPDRPRINTVHTCNYACIAGLQATWAGSVAAMCGRIRYTLYFIKFNGNVVKLIHKNED